MARQEGLFHNTFDSSLQAGMPLPASQPVCTPFSQLSNFKIVRKDERPVRPDVTDAMLSRYATERRDTSAGMMASIRLYTAAVITLMSLVFCFSLLASGLS